MSEESKRLTLAHEEALAEAVRVYTNQCVAARGISFGLGVEGRLLDEAMSIVAAIVGENLQEAAQ